MKNPVGDIEINGKPYMIARDAYIPGRRLWRVFSIKTQAVRIQPSLKQYVVGDPDVRFPLVWDDFSDGYGMSQYNPLHPNAYAYSLDHDASTPGQITPAALNVTITLNASQPAIESAIPMNGIGLRFQSNDYFFYGKRSFRISSADSVAELTTTATYYWFADAAVFGTYVYCALYGSGYVQTLFQQLNSGGTFNQAPSGGSAVTFGVVEDRLWRGYLGTPSGLTAENAWVVTNVAMGADPMVMANWSAAFSVGESSAPITKIIEHNGLTIVAKTDGLYYYDTTNNRFKNILSASRIDPNRDNGICTCSWQGMIIYNTQQALYAVRIDGTTGALKFDVFEITPGHKRKNDTPVAGVCVGAIASDRYLFVSLQDTVTATGDYWVLKGKLSDNPDELVKWDIHATPAGRQVRSLFLSSLFGRLRLYQFERRDTTDTRTVYQTLVPGGSNPVRYQNYAYQDWTPNKSAFYLPDHDAGAPGLVKAFQSLVIETQPFSFSGSVAALMRIDRGTYFTLGVVDQTNNPQTIFNITAGSGIGTTISPAIIIARANASQAPVVTKVWAVATARPLNVRGYEAFVRLVDFATLNDGSRDKREMWQVSQDLYSLRATGPVTLVTPMGDERTVLVLNNIEEEDISQFRGNAQPELVAKVSMIDWS